MTGSRLSWGAAASSGTAASRISDRVMLLLPRVQQCSPLAPRVDRSTRGASGLHRPRFQIQFGQLFVHRLAYFLSAEVEEDGFVDEGVQRLLQAPLPLGPAVDLTSLGDEESQPVARVEHAVAH